MFSYIWVQGNHATISLFQSRKKKCQNDSSAPQFKIQGMTVFHYYSEAVGLDTCFITNYGLAWSTTSGLETIAYGSL